LETLLSVKAEASKNKSPLSSANFYASSCETALYESKSYLFPTRIIYSYLFSE